MILAVGQEMQIYSSSDLKDWTLESKFGEGQGAHGGVWECPDLIELPIEGTELKNGCLFVTLIRAARSEVLLRNTLSGRSMERNS